MSISNKIVATFFLLIAMVKYTNGQIITTVAGNGSFSVFTGDGGPATAAGIHLPSNVFVDNVGNFYFCNHYVRKVTAVGIVDTFAGGGSGLDGGPARGANIGPGPCGMAIDGAGNYYIATGNKIRKVDSTGTIHTYAGTGISSYSGDGGPATAADMGSPTHIVFDVRGNLYVSFGYYIRKIDTSGIISTFAGINVAGYSGDGGPATAARFSYTNALAADLVGNIYVADIWNHVIRKIDTFGIITTFAGTGVSGYSGDSGPASIATFDGPSGLAFDPWGNLIVADAQNSRIRMISPAGIVSTIAGIAPCGFSGDGAPATAATLCRASTVSVDPQGNIYVNDRQNGRIRRISTLNRAPYFTHAPLAAIVACGEMNNIDTILQVMDSNSLQPITWSLAMPPAHGSAVVSYTTISTGGVLTPIGMGYTPATGYTGPDTFKVRVFDGGAADTITIAVDVLLLPTAAPITGADTVCVGTSATLTGPGSGAWSSPHGTVGLGAGTGVVTGISIGTAIVTYTVTNDCGTATATHALTILPSGECPTGIAAIPSDNAISIFPNPNDGAFTVQLPLGSPARITVKDMVGRTVKTLSATTTTQVKMDAAAGVYFVEVVVGGVLWFGKVVVR